MVQQPIDTLLEGVDGEIGLDDYEVIGNDSEFPEQELPYIQEDKVESKSDKESLEEMDKEELDDLLEDGQRNFQNSEEVQEEEPDLDPEEPDPAEESEDNAASFHDGCWSQFQ